MGVKRIRVLDDIMKTCRFKLLLRDALEDDATAENQQEPFGLRDTQSVQVFRVG